MTLDLPDETMAAIKSAQALAGVGDTAAAREAYLRARESAVGLDDDDYGRTVRSGIEARLEALRSSS